MFSGCAEMMLLRCQSGGDVPGGNIVAHFVSGLCGQMAPSTAKSTAGDPITRRFDGTMSSCIFVLSLKI